MMPEPCWRITLDTNPDHCNMHCMMCEDHSDLAKRRKRNLPGRPLMPRELLESVLEQAVRFGVKEIIPSTMGEPLIYPHFNRIVEFCTESSLSLNLTTNGTFPPGPGKRSVEDWANLIVPVASDIKISWNGATEKTQQRIMPGTTLAGHVDNANRFLAVRDERFRASGRRCRMTMQITFMELNLAELPAMLRLAHEMGFDRIKGHHLWTHFPELECLSLRRSPDSISRWNDMARHCRTLASHMISRSGQEMELANFFDLDPALRDDISPHGKCPFLGKEAWVNSEGEFNVCCAPDLLRRSLGTFGNLREKTLDEIWNSPAYRTLCETYMKNALCQTCNMRR